MVRQVEVSFADPRRTYTKAFERYALELSRSMTIQDVAHHLGVGWDLIKDIQKRDLSRRFAKPKLKHLRRIAIDEIAVAKGHRYLTVVMDLESGAVVFVGDGKGADALKPFWKRLRPSRAKIEAVAMDMSAAYRSAVPTHLPEAKIVFDHFHVVKLFNEKLSDLRRALYREATEVMHKEVLKGTRWLLLKNPENLDAKKDEKKRLEEALALNEPLATAYYMKEDLRRFWEQPGKWFATTFLRRLDSPSRGVGDQDPPADGQDVGGAPLGFAGVLRCDDHERADGGDEQQDQDNEASGVRFPRPGVLQAEDPGNPRDEVCPRWIIASSLSYIDLRQCKSGSLPPDEPERPVGSYPRSSETEAEWLGGVSACAQDRDWAATVRTRLNMTDKTARDLILQ